MEILRNPILCDGCGLPASPEHLGERVARLELATRFRPIHIQTVFVALSPMIGFENDFYGPPIARNFFDSMMRAAEIVIAPENDAAKLAEFQHRGYYVSYLSECPIPADRVAADAAISRLGPNLVRRIRFNYKPKQIAVLGTTLAPLIEILTTAGLSSLLHADRAQPMAFPEADRLNVRPGTGESLLTG